MFVFFNVQHIFFKSFVEEYYKKNFQLRHSKCDRITFSTCFLLEAIGNN